MKNANHFAALSAALLIGLSGCATQSPPPTVLVRTVHLSPPADLIGTFEIRPRAEQVGDLTWRLHARALRAELLARGWQEPPEGESPKLVLETFFASKSMGSPGATIISPQRMADPGAKSGFAAGFARGFNAATPNTSTIINAPEEFYKIAWVTIMKNGAIVFEGSAGTSQAGLGPGMYSSLIHVLFEDYPGPGDGENRRKVWKIEAGK